MVAESQVIIRGVPLERNQGRIGLTLTQLIVSPIQPRIILEVQEGDSRKIYTDLAIDQTLSGPIANTAESDKIPLALPSDVMHIVAHDPHAGETKTFVWKPFGSTNMWRITGLGWYFR
jgi:hypothetical protein